MNLPTGCCWEDSQCSIGACDRHENREVAGVCGEAGIGEAGIGEADIGEADTGEAGASQSVYAVALQVEYAHISPLNR